MIKRDALWRPTVLKRQQLMGRPTTTEWLGTAGLSARGERPGEHRDRL